MRLAPIRGAALVVFLHLVLGDVEENADGTYERAAGGVKDCLGAASKASEKSDGEDARTTVVRADSGPPVRIVSRDVSGDAYLVELGVDGSDGRVALQRRVGFW